MTNPQGYILYRIYYGDDLVYLGRTKQPLQSRIRGHLFKKPMHRLIGALLSSGLKEQEKLNIIEHEYNIPISNELREDVRIMCNLSQGIVDDTKAEIIMNMYKKGYTLEQIADVTVKSISEIEEIVKKEPVMA